MPKLTTLIASALGLSAPRRSALARVDHIEMDDDPGIHPCSDCPHHLATRHATPVGNVNILLHLCDDCNEANHIAWTIHLRRFT